MRRITIPSIIALSGLAVLLSAPPAHAATITFQTVSGTTALVTFTTSLDTLTIEVQNLGSNPRSFGEVIKGLEFTVESAMDALLVSATGTLRTVLNDDRSTQDEGGSYADLLGQNLDWLLKDSTGETFYLTAMGSGGPDQTIIGEPGSEGLYGAANGSLAGNRPHNTFVAPTSSLFTLWIPGLTSDTPITSVLVRFGNGSAWGECISGCPDLQASPGPGSGELGSDLLTSMPEPASLFLLGTGLASLAAARRRTAGRPGVSGR